MMTRDELLELHQKLGVMGRDIMSMKNEDYAHGDDPFANFRGSEFLGMDPRMGILLRVMDKIRRLHAYTERGEMMVKSEPVRDSVLDIINYMVLFWGMSLEHTAEADGQKEPYGFGSVLRFTDLDKIESKPVPYEHKVKEVGPDSGRGFVDNTSVCGPAIDEDIPF